MLEHVVPFCSMLICFIVASVWSTKWANDDAEFADDGDLAHCLHRWR